MKIPKALILLAKTLNSPVFLLLSCRIVDCRPDKAGVGFYQYNSSLLLSYSHRFMLDWSEIVGTGLEHPTTLLAKTKLYKIV